jgi:DNA-binding CsgD family transcriptional regulator
MARMGRPVAEVTLAGDQRDTVVRWSRRAKSSQALALRCKIVLAPAGGLSNTEIAEQLRCHPVTVGK